MRRLLVLPLMVVLVAAAGCGGGGGDDGGGSGASGGGAGAQSDGGSGKASTADAADFPSTADLGSYPAMRDKYGKELNLAPGVSLLRKGPNRVPFLVLDAEARPMQGPAIAIYTMREDGTGLRGPFPATHQPFGIGPAYLSRTSASDPNQQKAFYVADVAAPSKQPIVAFALVKQGAGFKATSPTTIGIKPYSPAPPDVGDKAIAMKTLTPDDVNGDYNQLTTRVPPAKDLVETNLQDVLGKKPTVLIFATPALCQSRVCGPDVDVAEQVKNEFGDKVAWVHQEIYRDNDPQKGLREQVETYRLQSEPWIYLIEADGTVEDRIEGAISVPELDAAVKKLLAS